MSQVPVTRVGVNHHTACCHFLVPVFLFWDVAMVHFPFIDSRWLFVAKKQRKHPMNRRYTTDDVSYWWQVVVHVSLNEESYCHIRAETPK